MTTIDANSFLDRPAARFCALAVAILALAGIALLLRQDLVAGAAKEDPFAACVNDRMATVDKQRQESVITAAQADLFKSRISALCAAQTRRQEEDILPGLPRPW
jgi:hypothetical protein